MQEKLVCVSKHEKYIFWATRLASMPVNDGETVRRLPRRTAPGRLRIHRNGRGESGSHSDGRPALSIRRGASNSPQAQTEVRQSTET
jgi:hypothetical protein